MRSRKRLILSAISSPESSCRKCRPVTSSGPSACGKSSLKRVANVLWSNTSSSLPHTRSVGNFDRLSSRSSHKRDWTTRAWLLRFLEALGHRGPVMVAGHDIGGGVAQHLMVAKEVEVPRVAVVNGIMYDSW